MPRPPSAAMASRPPLTVGNLEAEFVDFLGRPDADAAGGLHGAHRRSPSMTFADQHGMPLQEDVGHAASNQKSRARGRSGSRRRRKNRSKSREPKGKGKGDAAANAAGGHASLVRTPSRGSSVCSSGRTPSVDNRGRPFDLQCVVVNFNNVGTTYGKRMLQGNDLPGSSPGFHWEGVRLCVKHLTQRLQMRVIGVIFVNWLGLDGPLDSLLEVAGVPSDIAALCDTIEEAPRICGSHQKSADDEMTIKMAQRRNCRMLDNDNYRDWARHHPDREIRAWLKHSRRCVQMNYYFDSSLGCFETLDGMRAQDPGEWSGSDRASSSEIRPLNRTEENASAASVAATVGKGALAGHLGRGGQGKGAPKGGANAQACNAGSGKGNSAARKASRRRGRSKSNSGMVRGDPDRKVHVSNLDWNTNWQELREHMSQAGPVEFVRVATEDGSDRGKSLGWGCVLFTAREGAEAAVTTINGIQLRGRPIAVRRWVVERIDMHVA